MSVNSLICDLTRQIQTKAKTKQQPTNGQTKEQNNEPTVAVDSAIGS